MLPHSLPPRKTCMFLIAVSFFLSIYTLSFIIQSINSYYQFFSYNQFYHKRELIKLISFWHSKRKGYYKWLLHIINSNIHMIVQQEIVIDKAWTAECRQWTLHAPSPRPESPRDLHVHCIFVNEFFVYLVACSLIYITMLKGKIIVHICVCIMYFKFWFP